MKWQKTKTGKYNLKQGRHIIATVFKRPHGGWCWAVFQKMKNHILLGGGYFSKLFSFRLAKERAAELAADR